MGGKIRLAQKLAQLSTQEEVRGSTRKFHQCKKDNLLKPHTNNYNNLLEVTKNDQNVSDYDGGDGRIRTGDCTVLQTVPLDHSGTSPRKFDNDLKALKCQL